MEKAVLQYHSPPPPHHHHHHDHHYHHHYQLQYIHYHYQNVPVYLECNFILLGKNSLPLSSYVRDFKRSKSSSSVKPRRDMITATSMKVEYALLSQKFSKLIFLQGFCPGQLFHVLFTNNSKKTALVLLDKGCYNSFLSDGRSLIINLYQQTMLILRKVTGLLM